MAEAVTMKDAVNAQNEMPKDQRVSRPASSRVSLGMWSGRLEMPLTMPVINVEKSTALGLAKLGGPVIVAIVSTSTVRLVAPA